MLVSSFNPAFTQITHAVGRLKKFQLVTSAIALSVVPISYVVLVMGAEPYSVFIVSITLTFITVFACMLLVKQIFEYSIKDYSRKVLFPAFIVTLLAPLLPFVIHWIMPQSFLRLVFVTIVSITCTCVLSYSVLLDNQEKEFIKSKFFEYVKKYRA